MSARSPLVASIGILSALAIGAFSPGLNGMSAIGAGLLGGLVLAILAYFAIGAIWPGLLQSAQIAAPIARGEHRGAMERMKDGVFAETSAQSADRMKARTEPVRVADSKTGSGKHALPVQVARLRDVAASMKKLVGEVRQGTNAVKQAKHLAADAAEFSARGANVAGRLSATMQAIRESSSKTAAFVGVLDGIALQTYGLALNAALVAADAGGQETGAKAVADELGALAQRCAAAAEEIRKLIGDSERNVGAATRLADEADRTMQNIMHSAVRVAGVVEEVSAASQEQSTKLELVNTAIGRIERVTRRNAASLASVSAGRAPGRREATSGRTNISRPAAKAAHGGAGRRASGAPYLRLVGGHGGGTMRRVQPAQQRLLSAAGAADKPHNDLS